MKQTLTIICLGFLIAVVGLQSSEAAISGITDYKFDPNPQEPKPKMYNWEIMLNAVDSTNGTYEIIQITQPFSEDGINRTTTNVLIGLSPMSHSEMIIPNEDGIIDFKLYIGDKELAQNMNGPGKIGQPIIFSGIGTGKGASDWIVLPGSKVDRVTPSGKGTQLSDGRLNIIQYIVTNDGGEKFQADVILLRK
jgi:hypothetical protein